MRVYRRAGGGSTAARHGYRPAVLRQTCPDRPVVSWELPAHTPALGPRAGPSVLRPAAPRRLQPRRLRPGAGRRSYARRGGVFHHSPAALPRQRRRAARKRQLPRHGRYRVLDRCVRRDGATRSTPWPDARFPGRVARPFRHLHVGPSAAVRWQLLRVTRCARARRRCRLVDPRRGSTPTPSSAPSRRGVTAPSITRCGLPSRRGQSGWRCSTTTRAGATRTWTIWRVVPPTRGSVVASK